MIVKKGVMPWWCFLLPKRTGRNRNQSLRTYWLGYVFIKTVGKAKRKNKGDIK